MTQDDWNVFRRLMRQAVAERLEEPEFNERFFQWPEYVGVLTDDPYTYKDLDYHDALDLMTVKAVDKMVEEYRKVIKKTHG